MSGAGTAFRKPFGFVEWFRPGDHDRVEEAIEGLEEAGASRLRTHLSWAEYLAAGGEAWFDWLIPKLGSRIDLLPCIHYTPPSLSRTGKTSGPPVDLKAYGDFIDHVLTRYGRHFGQVELWNEPNNLLDWDWRLDSDYRLFCEMVGGAAYWVQKRGWKAVLGGSCPFDPVWLDLMGERGVLGVVDAVGFHGFPGTWESEESSWGGWETHLNEMRAILDRHNRKAAIWITETGYSTWRNDEIEQVRAFARALEAPAERVYWYGWRDIPADIAVQEGLWFDPRHYHLGAVKDDNRPKLLARVLAGGQERLADFAGLPTPGLTGHAAPIVVTGGSGFIGSNLADSLLADGEEVVVLDNLSRSGVNENLAWLQERHGARVHPFLADVRDLPRIEEAFRDAKAVFHLAAQTAVTTSLANRMEDFEVNARGTLNVLESVHRAGGKAPIVFASTNKVYGSLSDVPVAEDGDRYQPVSVRIRDRGIGEDRPLDFHTPYGCSKGAADQYVLDYAHCLGLRTCVMRMSCIYGARQFGTEDQGWVAHFLLQALQGREITIYGDGKQVRDILEISDAVRAYRLVLDRIDSLSGRAFNLGGGPANAVSLRQVLREIEHVVGDKLRVRFDDWRPGDQFYFVADTAALAEATGWQARRPWQAGIRLLSAWLRDNRIERDAVSDLQRRAAS